LGTAPRQHDRGGAPDRRVQAQRRNAEFRDDLAPILAEREAISREEPWHVHPERYGVDSLNEVVRAVLDVALGDGGDKNASERLVRAAAAHGDQRRIQATGDEALLREYHAVRASLWRYLLRVRMPSSEAVTAIARVDMVITVATTAALRGYHRSDMAPSPEWASELLRAIASGSREIVASLGREGRLEPERRGPSATGQATGPDEHEGRDP
jgi:hypothetical protein